MLESKSRRSGSSSASRIVADFAFEREIARLGWGAFITDWTLFLGSQARGKAIVNTVPFPSSLEAVMWPPDWVMIP
jgi:hypothetical protein